MTARTTLRLHRPALLVWSAFVALALAALLWIHLSLAPAQRAEAHCTPLPDCVDQSYFALTDVNNVMNTLGEVLGYACCAVAAWAGAALVARELETGTARLAWTQSTSPARWLAVRLASAAVPLAVGSALVAAVFGWVWSSDKDVLVTHWSLDRVFVPGGPVYVALSLAALAVGALAGTVLRRTLPALAVALGVTLVLRVAVVRDWSHLWPTRSYWPLQLSSTTALLLLTTLLLTLTFPLLQKRPTP